MGEISETDVLQLSSLEQLLNLSGSCLPGGSGGFAFSDSSLVLLLLLLRSPAASLPREEERYAESGDLADRPLALGDLVVFVDAGFEDGLVAARLALDDARLVGGESSRGEPESLEKEVAYGME